MDAVEPCGAGVDADRLRVKPDVREPQQRPCENHADHGDEDRRRDCHARQEIAVIRKRRIGDHGQFVVIDPCSNGTTGRVENQRSDHRLNFKDRDERAVERTEEHRDDTAGQKRRDDRRLQRIRTGICAAQHAQHDAARNGDGRADGDILSAGGRRYERHANGKNDQLGSVVKNCDQVARQDQIAEAVFLQRNGEERGVCDKVEYDQNQKCSQRDKNLLAHQPGKEAALRFFGCPGHACSPPAMVFMMLLWLRSLPRSSPTTCRSRMTTRREQTRSISSISDEINVTLLPSAASCRTSF